MCVIVQVMISLIELTASDATQQDFLGFGNIVLSTTLPKRVNEMKSPCGLCQIVHPQLRGTFNLPH